jgi:hypothetical protein
MAVRVRHDGTIWCAAMTLPEPSDRAYIDDGLHYTLSVELGALVTDPEPEHTRRGGQWWWRHEAPARLVGPLAPRHYS